MPNPIGRPVGYRKPNPLIARGLKLSLPKYLWEWYDALPDGTKNRRLREAIAEYVERVNL